MKQFINELKEFIKELRQRINEFLNDENKRYLKIFGICYCVAVLIGIIWVTIMSYLAHSGFGEYIFELAFAILCPICLIVVFSPAIFALKFLFGKIQNIVARVVLTVVIFPFTNMIYFLIGCYSRIDVIEPIAMLLGFFAIFWFVPTAFLSALFMPKKLLPRKYICAGTLALMDFFGLVLATYLLDMYVKVID